MGGGQGVGISQYRKKQRPGGGLSAEGGYFFFSNTP